MGQFIRDRFGEKSSIIGYVLVIAAFFTNVSWLSPGEMFFTGLSLILAPGDVAQFLISKVKK
jgi:hypothetical protein